MLLFTNEARTRLAVGDAVGRTKFRLALQKEAGAGTPAEVPATLAELQANRKHSETPTQRSQANLALASHVRGALGALGRMPPSLDASFNNLFDLERGNQLPPYLVDDLEPPAAPAPAAAQPAQPYYGRVSVGSGTVRARACGTAGMVLACISGFLGSSSPLICAFCIHDLLQVEPKPIELPPHGLSEEELAGKWYGLQAIAPSQCKLLAPQLKAFKTWLTVDIRLDRMPGLEQSGNQK